MNGTIALPDRVRAAYTHPRPFGITDEIRALIRHEQVPLGDKLALLRRAWPNATDHDAHDIATGRRDLPTVERVTLENVTIDVQVNREPTGPHPDVTAVYDVWIHDAKGRLIGSAQEFVEGGPEGDAATAALVRAYAEAVKAAAS